LGDLWGERMEWGISCDTCGRRIQTFTEKSAPCTREKYDNDNRNGKILGISRKASAKQIDNLKKEGELQYIGPEKSGYWEVLDENLKVPEF